MKKQVPTRLEQYRDSASNWASTAGWADEILKNGRQLSEDVGEELAKWAAGTKARTYDDVLADFAKVSTSGQLGSLRAEVKAVWGKLDEAKQAEFGIAGQAAKVRIDKAEKKNEPTPEE